MSTKTQVEWRRNRVFELSSKGHSQVEIAKTFRLGESTISRDLDYLRSASSRSANLGVSYLHVQAEVKYLAVLIRVWILELRPSDISPTDPTNQELMFNWPQIHMSVLKLKQLRQILDISTHPVSPDCAGTVNEGHAKTCTVTYASVGN